jgi:mono/diheme cytochrome c family protein
MNGMRQIVIVGSILAVFALTPASAEELSEYNGEQLFSRFCAACHGENAEGNGPVAPFFKIAPPDLTRLAKRRGNEFPTEDVRRIIDGRNTKGPHGTRQMPVWGMELQFENTVPAGIQKPVEELINRLVGYLRSIQK